jgi:small multidrug resistance pump
MKWLVLCFGSIFKGLGIICMKYAHGFTRLIPLILVFVFYRLAFAVPVFVLKKTEVSIAYIIRASTGTTLIAVVSIIGFRETSTKVVYASLAIPEIPGLEVSEKPSPIKL